MNHASRFLAGRYSGRSSKLPFWIDPLSNWARMVSIAAAPAAGSSGGGSRQLLPAPLDACLLSVAGTRQRVGVRPMITTANEP